jgi:hypothetical protein
LPFCRIDTGALAWLLFSLHLEKRRKEERRKEEKRGVVHALDSAPTVA